MKNGTKTLVTMDSLVEQLHSLGVQPGMKLLVHSSLSSIGWVCGGAPAVILALEQVLGATGLLVMPTHSTDLTDPATWLNPPVPKEWWDAIRQSMPPFDKHLTPALGMGTIPETFRKQDGVLRSCHPHFSFATFGTAAEEITKSHPLAFGLGEQSPLGKLYDMDAWILLIGVGHNSNTSIHLAEYKAMYSTKAIIKASAPLVVDGVRKWLEFDNIHLDESDFSQIGNSMEATTKFVQIGFLGDAQSRLIPQRDCVDFAVQWMEAHR
jgi:aminoglycoside 3-N-acetyltransferase